MKKKKYKPRPINPLAYKVAMQGAAKLTVDDVLRFVLSVDVAVINARKGEIDKAGWQSIFNAINMLEAFIRMKIAFDEDGAIEHMQQTVIGILDRMKERGTKTLYAQEIETLMNIRATYAQVLSNVTHSQYFDAEEIVQKRLSNVMNQKPPRGVYIVNER
jgi:hypothetical protein